MNNKAQIESLGTMDGFTNIRAGQFGTLYGDQDGEESLREELPHYLTSYDSIIRLIQKQPDEIYRLVIEQIRRDVNVQALKASPAEFCEALLRATGIWKP